MAHGLRLRSSGSVITGINVKRATPKSGVALFFVSFGLQQSMTPLEWNETFTRGNYFVT